MAWPSNRPRVRDHELLAVLQGQAVEPAYYGQMTAPAQLEVQDEISESMAAIESAAQLRKEMRLAKKAQRRQSPLLYSSPFSDIYTDPWVRDALFECTLRAVYAVAAVAICGSMSSHFRVAGQGEDIMVAHQGDVDQTNTGTCTVGGFCL